MNSLSTMKLAGIALMIVGAGLAIWGYQMSGSIGSQLTRTFTGSDTDKVMIFYIAGAVSLAIGLFIFARKK